jgi:hypothetical protein
VEANCSLLGLVWREELCGMGEVRLKERRWGCGAGADGKMRRGGCGRKVLARGDLGLTRQPCMQIKFWPSRPVETAEMLGIFITISSNDLRATLLMLGNFIS